MNYCKRDGGFVYIEIVLKGRMKDDGFGLCLFEVLLVSLWVGVEIIIVVKFIKWC